MAETSKTREAKPAGRLGISPLGWTNDVLTDLGGDIPPKLESLNLQNYAEKIGEFAIRLLRRDMKLAYHYHLKMLVETADEIFAFLKATSEEVGLLLDTGHAYAAGATTAKSFDVLAVVSCISI
jgi:sugar phosphate isomerase/epimerase